MYVILTDKNGKPIDGSNPMLMQLTGSYAILKGQAKPAGQQNDTLLEYDTATGETTVYKYISGDWRKL